MSEYKSMIIEIARKMLAELDIEIMLKIKQKEWLEENFLKKEKNQKVIECDSFGCVKNLDEACSDSKNSVSKNSKGELFCKRFIHAVIREQEIEK